MTIYPRYLVEYPKMTSSFPFYMKYVPHTTHTPHRSDFLVLILIMDGEGAESINGRTYPAKRGTLTFLLPYQVHHLVAAHQDKPIMMYVCNFDMDLLFHGVREEELQRLLLEPDAGDSYVQLVEQEQARFEAIFADMFEEYLKSDRWSEVIVRAKLMEALARFDRIRRKEAPANEGKASVKASIWQVIHYIHTHYRESLSLASVARTFHFHPTYLSELFKRSVGLNFTQFLHEVRIRNACSLLLATKRPITDIASEVGFNSLNTFMRVFRQQKGCAPSVYRKNAATASVKETGF